MATKPATLRPVSLVKDGDDRLVVNWNDGHRSVFNWVHLRRYCPCAGCREERLKPPNPLRILSAEEVAGGPLRPVAITPVGYYAYKITWSDGHDTGIFTFENLRELCQCPECAARPK